MPQRLTLLAVLMLPILCFSQSSKDKDVPVFGKIDKSDLLNNVCDFDKDADAEVLADIGKFYFDFRGGTGYSETSRFVRIKILKDKGADQAIIKIRYKSFANEEYINNLSACTYNVDGTGAVVASKVEKNQIFDVKLNKRYTETTFTFPNVKAGSIIEYKYVKRGGEMSSWNMQNDIPVKYSKYILDIPSQYEVHLKSQCYQPLDVKDRSSSLRLIKEFTMQDVAALRDEAYMTCDDDYLQKIEIWPIAYNDGYQRIVIQKTWTQISKMMIDDEDFGVQLKKEIPRTKELDDQLKLLKDNYSKMIAVHNYVRHNMAWDGKDNIWALNGVKQAWKDKSGTSGEINLILVNLLKDAGMIAYPIMVSSHENGLTNISVPSIRQFNKVFALVNIDDRIYVLDGTDRFTPANLIPADVSYTDGLVIDDTNPNKFFWHTMYDSVKVEKNTVVLQARITDKGEMVGNAMVSSQDYARIKRTPVLASDKEKFMERFYKNGNSSIQIDSLTLKNENDDSLPLVQKFNFHTPVNSSGEYSYFSTNLFTGMRSNPFIADKRYSDVFFGENQSHTIIANITIPDGYSFEELPKNIRMTIEDKSVAITRMVAATENTLNARITVEFKRPYYTPDEYPNLREFYKKMYTLLDEQFVIKKKTGSQSTASVK